MPTQHSVLASIVDESIGSVSPAYILFQDLGILCTTLKYKYRKAICILVPYM